MSPGVVQKVRAQKQNAFIMSSYDLSPVFAATLTSEAQSTSNNAYAVAMINTTASPDASKEGRGYNLPSVFQHLGNSLGQLPAPGWLLACPTPILLPSILLASQLAFIDNRRAAQSS